MSIFKELEDKRNKWLDYDLTETQLDKLIGECKPGCKVEIYWGKEYDGIIDEGYVFIVDGMDADLGDCFIHVPQQDNPEGKEKGEPEWDYGVALLANEYCIKIICKK